jgi:hypothetical protein
MKRWMKMERRGRCNTLFSAKEETLENYLNK